MLSTLKAIGVLLVIAVPLVLLLGGCRTSAQSGALLGAAAGAAGGYMIGNEMDKGDHGHHHR